MFAKLRDTSLLSFTVMSRIIRRCCWRGTSTASSCPSAAPQAWSMFSRICRCSFHHPCQRAAGSTKGCVTNAWQAADMLYLLLQAISVAMACGTSETSSLLVPQFWLVSHPPSRGRGTRYIGTHPAVHAGFLRSWLANGLNRCNTCRRNRVCAAAQYRRAENWGRLTRSGTPIDATCQTMQVADNAGC